MLLMERDPNKRKVKPAQMLLEFEELGESSDDSDFRIEDHCEESDDDTIDSAQESDSSEEDGSDSDGEISISSKLNNHNGVELKVLTELQNVPAGFDLKNALQIMICSVCLGDRSDAQNEIIECDKCGVTVHEGCYGVQDSDSLCSTDSPNPTTPWFCDACKAGVSDPVCELCPYSGGIYKETDVGKWTHLVCALYMPGVAFAEVDRLSCVTLFEMSYTKWGSKPCSLCKDRRFASTGVTIACDAALCKNYFHVTCGQREGLLSEAHSEEVDQADPFYAHCKLHSDKTLIKKRKRNWLALALRSEEIKKHQKPTDEENRIERRLGKYRNKYHSVNALRPQPWVPTQKMARMLTSSASACRLLWKKAELSGVDIQSLELRQAHLDVLSDVHRRWHIQPAFSVEFIAYFLERDNRVNQLRKQLAENIKDNEKLLQDQVVIQEKRDAVVQKNADELDANKKLRILIEPYHELVKTLLPSNTLPNLDLMGRPVLYPPKSHSIATASATSQSETPILEILKSSGMNLSARKKSSDSRSDKNDEVPVGLSKCCGICYGTNDQHLLAKCDTCYKFYHLGCLSPPLSRMPKKTKLMGWQCSECDNNSDSSAVGDVDTEAPRKLRRRDSMDDSCSQFAVPLGSLSQTENNKIGGDSNDGFLENSVSGIDSEILSSVGRPGKKRRREKHHRYSPDPNDMGRPHKHKHKRRKSTSTMNNSGPILGTPPNSGCVPSELTATDGTIVTGVVGGAIVVGAPSAEHRQSLKICFKSIPSTGGGSSYVATPSADLSPGNSRLSSASSSSLATTATGNLPPVSLAPALGNAPVVRPSRLSGASQQKKKEESPTDCATCGKPGTQANLVKCDECLNGYHFSCLDPPVKKSPKVRGYSWHCANCDPTESE